MGIKLPYEGNIYISSTYGNRVINGKTDWHPGIDLVGKSEKTLRAPCDGVIVASNFVPKESGNKTWEWGNYVALKTEDNFVIYMCHMEERYVQFGQTVKAGQPIGKEGYSGYCLPQGEGGRHCHFEIRKDGAVYNPCDLLGIKNRVGLIRGNTFTERTKPARKTKEEIEEEEDENMTSEKFAELWKEYRKQLQDNDASEYSKEAREWAVDNKLVQGTDSKDFNGMWEDVLTREQMITLLFRFYKLLK